MVSYLRASEDKFLAIKVCVLGVVGVLLAPLGGMIVGMSSIMSVLMRLPESLDQRAMIMPFVQAGGAVFREDLFLPVVLIAAAAHIIALQFRWFGIGAYLMLGCIGGVLMIVPVGGFEIPHPREVVFFMRMVAFSVPLGAWIGGILWLVAVWPLRSRLKRAAGIGPLLGSNAANA